LDAADDGMLVPVVPDEELPKEMVEDVQFVSDTVFAVSLSLYTTTVLFRDPALAFLLLLLCGFVLPHSRSVSLLSGLDSCVCVCVCDS
jgi:hypothetical protein